MNKSHSLRIVTMIAVLCLLGHASIASSQWTETHSKEVAALVEAALVEEEIPGVSVGVVRDGEFVWAEGFGLANLEAGIPATADTVYRIASISKMITAAAVMKLVETGAIDLHAPIQTYTDAFPRKQWPITVHHLLCHQSGIRHWRTAEELKNEERYESLEDAIASFKDEPLLFEPGTRDEYSTPAYTVLGIVIEEVTGKPFADAISELVTGPAGANSLRPDHLQPAILPQAARYRDSRRGPKPAPDHDITIKIPGGGFSGSATDLARFAAALMNGEIVEEATLATMWEEKPAQDVAETQKGYGCNLGSEKERFVVWHIGGLVGASGILYIYPEEKHAIALLTNRRASPVFPLASEIMDVVVSTK